MSVSTGMTRENVQSTLLRLFDIVGECCVQMDTVIVPGFGQFEPKKRKERLTVHPSTGKRLLVPPKLVVGFRPSGVMKSKLQ